MTDASEVYVAWLNAGNHEPRSDHDAFCAGYRAGVAASPSEELVAALVAADRLAEYVEFQGRSGHNWPTTAEAQRTYVTARRALLALRTTKEGADGT